LSKDQVKSKIREHLLKGLSTVDLLVLTSLD
jgi:hypothetical protein